MQALARQVLLLLQLGVALGLELAPLLLLDLLKGLEEELLDITALIENHLAQSLQVGSFANL